MSKPRLCEFPGLGWWKSTLSGEKYWLKQEPVCGWYYIEATDDDIPEPWVVIEFPVFTVLVICEAEQ